MAHPMLNTLLSPKSFCEELYKNKGKLRESKDPVTNRYANVLP